MPEYSWNSICFHFKLRVDLIRVYNCLHRKQKIDNRGLFSVAEEQDPMARS